MLHDSSRWAERGKNLTADTPLVWPVLQGDKTGSVYYFQNMMMDKMQCILNEEYTSTYPFTDTNTYPLANTNTYPRTDTSSTYSLTDTSTYPLTDTSTYPLTDTSTYPLTDTSTYPLTDTSTYPLTDTSTYPLTDTSTYPLTDTKVKSKVVHLYSAFSIWRCSKALYNDQFTPSGLEAYIQSSQCMLVLILLAPKGWKAELTLAAKKVPQIFNPRPGWGLNRGPQDLEAEIFTTAPTPPL